MSEKALVVRTTTTKQQMKKTTAGKKKPRNKKKPTGGLMVPHLSPCADAYLRVLSDPWDVPDATPCIPDVITLPSYKFQTKIRGIFTVGIQGVGWVSLAPRLAFANDLGITGSLIDIPCLSTTAAYAESSYGFLVSGGTITTPGVVATNATSPFGNALFGSGAKIRLVGGGIRARYSGTELNRGGRMIVHRHRGNENVQVFSSSATLLSDPTTYCEPITRNYQGVTYVPSDPALLSYESDQQIFPSRTGTSASEKRSLLLYVDGAVPGSSFEFEACCYYEAIGTNFAATHSSADPVGFGAVLSSLPEKVTTYGQATYNLLKKGALSSLERTASGLFNVGGAYLMSGAASYLNSPKYASIRNTQPYTVEL